MRIELTFDKEFDSKAPKMPVGHFFDIKPAPNDDEPGRSMRSWHGMVSADRAKKGDFVAIVDMDHSVIDFSGKRTPRHKVTLRATMDKTIYYRHVDILQEIFKIDPETVRKLVLEHGEKPCPYRRMSAQTKKAAKIW